MKRVWDDFLIVLGFFTRLPVGDFGGVWQGRLASGAWAFPVVGAAIGAVGASAWALALWSGLSPLLAAVFAVIAQVLATGALHEDGLGDIADGFGGGRDRAAKLEIMRDSRVGAYGVLAIVLAVVMRIAAIAELHDVFATLLAAGAVSRAAIAGAMAVMPAVRGDGLGAATGQSGGGALLSLIVALLVCLLTLGLTATLIVSCAAAVAWAGICGLAKWQIGGQTGDVLGACQQICELAVLVALAAYGV
jgi:adenosylcobinamide-GDP ribazoletransferase